MEPIYAGGLVILGAVVWLVCAYLAYQTAPKFGRGAGTWLLLGIVFGPFALMALYVLPHHEAVATAGSKAAHKDPRADLYEVPKKHR